MTLTKRQWIMFTLFIIELSYVLFTSALVGSLLVISSSLSTLLFLGALYLEHNYNSKRMLLLAGVWLIVNMIFSMIQVFPVLISNFNTDVMFDVAVVILLYVGIYKFSMMYYQGNFYRRNENILVSVLVIPTILMVGYQLYLYLKLPLIGNPLEITYVFIGFISKMIIPLAILTYTWLRHKNIE